MPRVAADHVPLGFVGEGEAEARALTGDELLSNGYRRLPCDLFTHSSGAHFIRILVGKRYYWLPTKGENHAAKW